MDSTTAIQILNRAAAYLDDLWHRATEEEEAKFPLGAQEIDRIWEMAKCLARDMGPLDNILADSYSARLLLHATDICINCLGEIKFQDFATAFKRGEGAPGTLAQHLKSYPIDCYIEAATRINGESKVCL